MTKLNIKNHLDILAGCITFEYNGYVCGIDPLAHDNFNMWYGIKKHTARSIDEVMKTKFFDGRALENIIGDITELDY